MPSKKKQHYVPQFMMREFAVDKDKKLINAFIINTKRLISSVPINSQCAKDYFYTCDIAVDESLKPFEDQGASILRDIISHNSIPPVLSEEHYSLVGFILLQSARTLRIEEEFNEIINKTFTIYARKALAPEQLDKEIRFRQEHSVLNALLASFCSIDLALDLECKLIINNTRQPFIISDNPVVKYNIMMELKGALSSCTGTCSKGLLMLCPISPLHYLLFYDNTSYAVGSRRQRVINLSIAEEVFKLNKLQAINSFKVLYGNTQIDSIGYKNIFQASEKHRVSQNVDVAEYPLLIPSQDDKERSIIAIKHNDIRCKLNLSFIRMFKSSHSYSLGNNAVHVRNERLYKEFQEFQTAVKAKEYMGHQLRQFLFDKYNNQRVVARLLLNRI